MSKTMISARIPESLGMRLDALAESTKRSKAYLLVEALESYVAARAWLTAEIQIARHEAKESGEFISHAAMERWADSLSSENPLQPPEPDVFKRKNG